MIALLLLTTALWGSPQDTLSPAARRILADVQFLAADSQEGRGVGTAGLQRSGAYIRDGFARAGLRVSYQDFTIPADAPAVLHTTLGGTPTRNVVAIIPGSSRALRGEIVVVGAHYDHLGLGGFGALDPDSTGRVHNGADDNASGTAALLEIGRILAHRRPARTVVLVAFSGEELGTLGSSYFVNHATPQPIDSLYAMLNLDMVGRLRNARLLAFGAATAREFPALLDSLNTPPRFDLRASGDGYGAYLGTIPRMSGGGVSDGVRITGVRAGSPAELAGLAGGDVITAIGDKHIANLYDMTDALRSHQAGDTVVIVSKRDGVERRATAVLGKRGT